MPFSNDRLSINNPTTIPQLNQPFGRSGVRLEPIPAPNSVFTQSFTGANGSSAPSPWIANTFAGTQNIQSNQWRMVSAGSYNGTAMTFGTTSYGDADFQITLTINNPVLEQYPAIMARGSGGTNGWVSPFAEQNQGYTTWFDTLNGQIHLEKYTSGASVLSLTTPRTPIAGQAYHYRLQCVGSRIRCALWIAGTQQDHWDLEMTDTTYTTGLWGFRDQAASNLCQANWDDFIFDDFSGGGGGTLYTDNVTTTIVVDTSGTVDQLSMFESLLTTAVGSTSDVDTAAFQDSLTTTAVGVTSETDVAAFQDAPTTTAVVVTSETDSLLMTEAVATTAVVVTSEVEQLSMVELLSTVAIATTSETDSAAYAETLTTTAIGVTTETDVAAFTDALATDITALTGELDQLSMFETPVTTAVVTTTETDQLSLFEFPSTTATVVTSESDSAAYVEPLNTTVVVLTAEDDILNGNPTPGIGFIYQSGPWKVMGRL